MTKTFDARSARIGEGLTARAAESIARPKFRGLSIVTAESCTAGLISAALAEADGAGQVLAGGFVIYSKEHKTRALAVDPELLRCDGAVSQAIAGQMLAGALAPSSANIGLAVTGVLGPAPDEDGNPVGLIFIAAGMRGDAPQLEKRG